MENNNKSMENLLMYNNSKLDSGKIWILFLFFGWSYGSMGQMGKQIFFYLTFGGFGLWTLIRLFTLNSSIKNHNRSIALRCGLTPAQLMGVGF